MILLGAGLNAAAVIILASQDLHRLADGPVLLEQTDHLGPLF